MNFSTIMILLVLLKHFKLLYEPQFRDVLVEVYCTRVEKYNKTLQDCLSKVAFEVSIALKMYIQLQIVICLLLFKYYQTRLSLC